MPNRLAHTNSPYLLQHAGNPVDWYPWGDEAFAKARAEDKPIFLSIGYATCHWCHVMEHESFEDEEVARFMNEAFVNVKVDREERPDVDGVYMDVCQAMTGHGGWPLTILMTPDARPFFAATYIPRTARAGRAGMLELVPRIRQLWQEERPRLLAAADEIVEALSRPPQHDADVVLDERSLEAAYVQLRARYDAEHGGFGGAPKFPTPHTLLFLLRYWKRTGDGQALGMVEKTLRAMRRGGLWDHVGYGFHRYATDRQWLLPHFEKMLYDQALLALAYTEVHRATGNPFYRYVAEHTLEYVARDLTAPEGAFYSAEDADSLDRHGHKEEGAFYTWTEADLRDAVGGDDFRFAQTVWGVEAEGNFEEEATRERTGQNVLHNPEPLLDLADRFDMGEGALREKIDGLRERLYDARAARPRPLLDDKVLTDWNGLMLVALARAARAFGEPRHAEAAVRAADFLLETMRTPDGGLLHRYRKPAPAEAGEAAIPGLLDDYAFLAWGLFELYQAVFDERYLEAALDLHRQAERRFADPDDGGFFFTEADGEPLLFRRKDRYDGAIPSGNAVAALNGLRLGRVTGDPTMEARAERALHAPEVGAYPGAHAFHLVALDYALGLGQEVVIAGERGAPDTEAFTDRLGRVYAPNAVFLLRAPGTGEAPITAIAPFTAEQTTLGSLATAYVCEHYACQAPTTDAEHAVRLLQGLGS